MARLVHLIPGMATHAPRNQHPITQILDWGAGCTLTQLGIRLFVIAAVQDCLDRAESVEAAAQELGTSRRTIYRWREKWGDNLRESVPELKSHPKTGGRSSRKHARRSKVP